MLDIGGADRNCSTIHGIDPPDILSLRPESPLLPVDEYEPPQLQPEDYRLAEALFDPWAGSSYPMSVPEEYESHIRELSWDLYGARGLDLETIAGQGIDNPLNESIHNPDHPLYEPALESELIPTLLMRSKSVPYKMFLEQMELPTGSEHIWNYEPNYLEALMDKNSEELGDAKREWLYRPPETRQIEELLKRRGPSWGE